MNNTSINFNKLLDSLENNPIVNPKTANDILNHAVNIINDSIDISPLKRFLNLTSTSIFLKSLESEENRYHWADIAFDAIRLSGYNLLDMMEYRIAASPDKIYFQDYNTDIPKLWSFKQVYLHTREIAAALWTTPKNKMPRVAIYSDNSFEYACCDLACLFYNIPVTPLNINFNKENLEYIFNSLEINIVITDTENRYEKLQILNNKVNNKFVIYFIGNESDSDDKKINNFGEVYKKLNGSEIEDILYNRKKMDINQVATIMFTSGSTGMPKGVSYSMYNLVTKRFARAAALPDVGNNEVLLCFLPFYHTFGRFLEMLGMLYWCGTYTFCENTSSETLIKYFPIINPTGFISIPLRWAQLYERINEEDEKNYTISNINNVIPANAGISSTERQGDSCIRRNDSDNYSSFRSVTGTRLRWGLSAAGYLSPDIFNFFEKNNVHLCSGFGMTEATGGITMTVPGQYIENSVGKVLPGITTQLDEKGEMILSGHYIAYYLEQASFYDVIDFPLQEQAIGDCRQLTGVSNHFAIPNSLSPVTHSNYLFRTGDIFRLQPGGYYEIIDRVKDIYKNNKGQTVSPRLVEQLFEGVPGIKRTFLVGDGKPFNVLFIIPDHDEPLLQEYKSKSVERDYFRQIVEISNLNLAPYERVINFELLERDFSLDINELTPKGSYNRKNITRNFSVLIEELYRSNFIELHSGSLILRLPRWFFRDLGILEDDIIVIENGLKNRVSNRVLAINWNWETGKGNREYEQNNSDKSQKINSGLPIPYSRFPILNSENPDIHTVQIGDFIYFITGNVIDLGNIVRQPALWCGNNELLAFYPCKEGWDNPINDVSIDVHFIKNSPGLFKTELGNKGTQQKNEININFKDGNLLKAHKLIYNAYFADKNTAMDSIYELGTFLNGKTKRLSDLIRHRFFALSEHNDEEVRCFAYRILLLDEPDESYNHLFGWFIHSGKTFIDKNSIEILSISQLEKRRLEALRKRMYFYRINLQLPASDVTHQQFANIFDLLVNFVIIHPDYYNSVRSELSAWILLKDDINLSVTARRYLDKLTRTFENHLMNHTPVYKDELWNSRIVYDEELQPREINHIHEILTDRIFLTQSILLAFEEPDFSLNNIPADGIWVYKTASSNKFRNYIISINTISSKHFDLLLTICDGLNDEEFENTSFWLISIAGYPFHPRVMKRIGSCRSDFKAITLSYQHELNVWEQIRQVAVVPVGEDEVKIKNRLKKLYIEAFTIYFRCWMNSGYKILPILTPSNVVVSELDLHEGAIFQTIPEIRPYENPESIFGHIIRNFYLKAVNSYPSCQRHLDIRWIFDACYESLDNQIAAKTLGDLLILLKEDDILCPNGDRLSVVLADYLNTRKFNYYPVLNLLTAINEFSDWQIQNPEATATACEQTIGELIRLYRIYQLPEIARYYLFRYTYFKISESNVLSAFDKFMKRYSINTR